MTALLPAVAVALMTLADVGERPALVSSRRSRSLHLYRPDPRLLGDALTERGVLRRGRRPLCGQRARRWYAAGIDGRPLCRKCSAAALALSPVVDGDRVARLVPLEDVLATVLAARTEADVSAVQILTCNAGYLGRMVDGPDGRVLLTRLIGAARVRVTSAPVLGPRDHAWAARRLRPVSRFPRRVR